MYSVVKIKIRVYIYEFRSRVRLSNYLSDIIIISIYIFNNVVIYSSIYVKMVEWNEIMNMFFYQICCILNLEAFESKWVNPILNIIGVNSLRLRGLQFCFKICIIIKYVFHIFWIIIRLIIYLRFNPLPISMNLTGGL